jgi:acyl carrier protein
MTNLDRLKNVFQEGLGTAAGTDFETLEYGNSIGWDSVAQLALIASIEKRFGIMLSSDDVISIDSFAKAKQVLAKHGIACDM